VSGIGVRCALSVGANAACLWGATLRNQPAYRAQGALLQAGDRAERLCAASRALVQVSG
jgi:hypothetical protein